MKCYYKMNNEYIITLTTIPSKFDNLYITLDSLVNQSLIPKQIIINIPSEYNFRMGNKQIPIEKIEMLKKKYLKSNSNVIFNILDKDYGPGTKLLGLFSSNIFSDIINKESTFIVLVDDDLIYKNYMLEYFDNYIRYQKENISVASYFVYEYNILIGQGADGFFIKSNLLKNFLDYYNIICGQDYLNYHDDFYISYYFNLINQTIYYIKPPYLKIIFDSQPNSQIDPLVKLEGKYSRNNLTLKSNEILNQINLEGEFDFIKNVNI